MTQSLMWIGFGAFFVASLTVGVRLVALWWENRQLPELLIGLGVLGIGPVGFGCVTLGQILQTDHGVAAGVVFAAACSLLATYAVENFRLELVFSRTR